MSKTQKKTLDQFRALHDKDLIVPTKIKEGLAKLGPDGWEYEADFMKLCGLCNTDFARYRDSFAEFFLSTTGKNQKRVWAGSRALASKMRQMVQV